MASNFEVVVGAVRAAYEALCVERGHGAVTSWLVGRLAVKEHKAMPYIGWVRGDVAFSAPDVVGPNKQDPNYLVTPLYDAKHTVLVLICGKNDEHTEELWFDVLAAQRAALGASGLPPGRARWVTQGDDEAAYVNADVELVIQEFVWPFIVPKTIERLTVVTAQEEECELEPA